MGAVPVILGYDVELLFATAVMGLRSLHYGFWDTPPKTIDLAAIREAQARFTDRLLEFVPASARAALDVGAGVGDNALALARRGLTVTAISPDRAHARYFAALHSKGIRYRKTRFEDLHIADRFDLVFMSETLNYFDRRTGLAQSRRYLAPDGHLLIAAMFRRPESDPYPADFSVADLDYVALAREYGFALIASRDVTANVLPTMEYTHRCLQRYVFPVMKKLPRRVPFTPLARLQELRSHYEVRTNPDYFSKYIRYAFLLFTQQSGPSQVMVAPSPHDR